MANTLYDAGRTLMLTGFDWAGATVNAYLIDTTYPYAVNAATDDTISDVPVGARVAGPIALNSKAIVAGAADAADVTFTSVTGATSEAIVLHCTHDGTTACDILLAYIDSATGLPITPNGGDIIIVWDNTTNRIFKP